MDSRFFGFIAIAFIMLLMYQAWVQDYAPAPPADIQATNPTEALDTALPEDIPQDLPPLPAAQQTSAIDYEKTVTQQADWIEVETDTLKLKIDLQGGNLISGELQQYPIDLAEPEKKIRLLQAAGSDYFVAQSGLLATQEQAAPNHYALYRSEQSQYRMQADERLQVPLYWETQDIRVIKTYSFTPGSYLIELEYRIENKGQQPWMGRQYRQLQRVYNEERKSTFIYTYTGGVIYSPEDKYQKISYDDMRKAPLQRQFKEGWAAMIQHYFLAAWLPQPQEENQYYSNVIDKNGSARYVLGLNSPTQQIMPGQSAAFSSRLYIGPKVQEDLESIATGLELTVDYGWLTPISKPLFWALEIIHDFVGNWGWAIVLLTLGIKLVFYKLSEASYKSMANMRKITPKIQSIRERYADDRQRQSLAMMELYKKEKLNPMGGCLPMLIQIPVFIALYWVLLESVELRQAPFIFWLEDLSTKDPYFVLPVLMGITMYFQQKLNPAPVDPIQAKVFMMLPFVFTVFFAFFPSGLVLYWLTNNTLTIAQQWYITHKVIGDGKK